MIYDSFLYIKRKNIDYCLVISYLFLKFATKVKVNQIIYIMKRSTHFYAFTFALLLVSTLAHATSIETINDLKYLIDTEKNEATLIAKSPNYSGDIIVPEKITSDGKDYPVTSLGDRCFNICSGLTSITIPSSVTSLGNSCFSWCTKLTSITIPSSVMSLGDGCFSGCSGFTSITIPSSVMSLGDECFSWCTKLTSITIPSSVTSLGNSCFYNCPKLASINIPSSVTSLKDGCFCDCSELMSITIPSSVTSLGHHCFSGCSGLTSIDIPSSVTSLGGECFRYCSKLMSINIPSSITYLGDDCFNACSGLTSITIPSSVTHLGNECLAGCSGLTSITIPSSITSLGDYFFSGCYGLTSITIPSSVTSLGDYCFSGCYGLTSITIPSSVTSLGNSCFNDCYGLTSIIIPSSVTSLGNSCFSWCTKLTSIAIPSSVMSLGDGCFNSCSNLTSISCYAIIPPECQYSFRGYNTSNCVLCVPKESIDKYKNADEWKSFPYILALEGSEPGGTITKCDVPSITFVNEKLHFSSTTQGAQYHYTITDKDMANGVYSQSGEVVLSAAYEISAYATADGHITSDSAKATLYWLPTSEVNNINSTSTRGIVATCNNGIITISGLKTQENVTFYTVNGEQLGTAAALDGVATYAVNAANDIVIAKFGGSSIKIATK